MKLEYYNPVRNQTQITSHLLVAAISVFLAPLMSLGISCVIWIEWIVGENKAFQMWMLILAILASIAGAIAAIVAKHICGERRAWMIILGGCVNTALLIFFCACLINFLINR